MRVAGSSLLYSQISLPRACERLSALGFERIDVGAIEGWAHIDPSAAAHDVDATATQIADACADANLDPVAFNVNAGGVDMDEEVMRVVALAAVADELGVEIITLPAASSDTPLDADLNRFRTLVNALDDYDVMPTVETHLDTHTEDPAVAEHYARLVPGLGLTLDPGHFAVGSHWNDNMCNPLLKHVRHVHIRQADVGRKNIQQPVDEGCIDFAALLADLEAASYNRTLTVEYIDSLKGADAKEVERQAAEISTEIEHIIKRYHR